MVFGTFDILHPGHLYFFKQAKKLGDKLIVVVARDVNVEKVKGFLPKLNEKERLQIVKSLKIVDKAALGELRDRYRVILKYKPDVICLGYDQKVPSNFLRELRKRGAGTKVVRLKSYRPEKYKSSLLSCSM